MSFGVSPVNQGVSIPGVRASLSAYLAHLVTCCERNTSQRKTSNLKGYYHLTVLALVDVLGVFTS